jgi:methyl-accepting chemotaxis protein
MKIKAKLVSLSVATAFMSLSIGATLLIQNGNKAVKSILEDEHAALTMVLGNSVSGALVFYDTDGAQAAVSSLRDKASVTGAMVFDVDGELVAQYTREGAADIDPGYAKGLSDWTGVKIENDSIVGRTIVRSEEDTVGSILVISDLTTLSTQQASALRMVGFVMLICISIAIVMSLILQRSITKPIDRIVRRVRDISEGEGDLTAKIEIVGKDELTDLAKYFNNFIGQVYDIISEVAHATQQVQESSGMIGQSTEDVSERMKEQSTQTMRAFVAVEEMSASVEQVATQAKNTAEQASDAKQIAEEGHQIVTETVDRIRLIADHVKQSGSAVEGLGVHADQIGDIISMINDVADQTNLLALNAAIEAARAGEHGRGFAVVADEVRKLAERTSSATTEVSESIQAIRNETAKVIKLTASSQEAVDEGTTFAEQAGDALERIVGSFEEVSTTVTSISASAVEQSATSSEITSGVDGIQKQQTENFQSIGEVADRVRELGIQSSGLQEIVGRFKL